MTIIASTELILIQTMCSSKLRMDFFHSGKHIMDRILLIRRVMLGAPSLWEIICKWPALWCCRVINKSSYQNEKWNFKNERVSINLGHWWNKLNLPSNQKQANRHHWTLRLLIIKPLFPVDFLRNSFGTSDELPHSCLRTPPPGRQCCLFLPLIW